MKVCQLEEDVKEIKESLRPNYVSQDQFVPVRDVVYGLVGIILFLTVSSFLVLVIRQPDQVRIPPANSISERRLPAP